MLQAIPLPILIAIGAGILLLLLLLILLLVRGRRKNAMVLEGGDFVEDEELSDEELELAANNMAATTATSPELEQMEEEFTKNEEILNLRMQRSLRLKQNIGDFVDQNPQIAAKLIQDWLRGEEESDNGRHKRGGG